MLMRPRRTAQISCRSLFRRTLFACSLLLGVQTTYGSEDGLQPADESGLATSDATTEVTLKEDIPVAPNMDLAAPQPEGIEASLETQIEAQKEDTSSDSKPAPAGTSFVMFGTEVPPATSTRLAWSPEQSLDGLAASVPVLVVNGAQPGPVLCVTAAVHGDELNGIEMVRSLLYNIEPTKLRGTVVGVPIVNLDGFRRNSRYLTDRRDLNRFFPGNPRGSSASRIAYEFFNKVILNCEILVDLHTGSFHRTNLPQLRANLKNDDVRELAEGFGDMVILHSAGSKGTLRRAATEYGIPSVTLEAGEPLRLQKKAVERGVKGLRYLLAHKKMYGKRNSRFVREPHYYKSTWIRADQAGILFSKVSLGERVKPGEVLGTITDPITNVRTEITSPYTGRVLGMALDQVLMPGFAAFRIGIQTSEEEVKGTIPAPKKTARVSIARPTLNARELADELRSELPPTTIPTAEPVADDPVAEEE